MSVEEDLDVVRLEGTVEESDYVGAQWLHLRPRRVMRVLGLLTALMLLGGGAVQIVGWAQGQNPLSDALMLPFLLSLALGYVALLRWQFTRSYRGYKAIHSPIAMEISEAGLHSRSEHGEARLPWHLFRKYKENDRMLLLYQAGNLFHVIPKRLFRGLAELDQAKSVIARHVKSAT
jgi:hypothetical protein